MEQQARRITTDLEGGGVYAFNKVDTNDIHRYMDDCWMTIWNFKNHNVCRHRKAGDEVLKSEFEYRMLFFHNCDKIGVVWIREAVECSRFCASGIADQIKYKLKDGVLSRVTSMQLLLVINYTFLRDFRLPPVAVVYPLTDPRSSHHLQ